MSRQEVIRVGINGFGRIGRTVFRQLLQREKFQVVGINDLADLADLAYLLKYDSVHGWYSRKVAVQESAIQVDQQTIPFFSNPDPKKIPWKDTGADIIIECSGALRSRAKAAGHLEAGAKRVIISAPSDDADAMIVLGVNEEIYRPESHQIVSMASCTTNCLAPVAKVLHESFGVAFIMFTTSPRIHIQPVADGHANAPSPPRPGGRPVHHPHHHRRGPSRRKGPAAVEGKNDRHGHAGSRPRWFDYRHDGFPGKRRDFGTGQRRHAGGIGEPPLQGILRVTDEELVSQDIIGDPHSSIVDAQSTMVLNNRIVKILSWYDNEWGYSARLVDFAEFMAGKGLTMERA